MNSEGMDGEEWILPPEPDTHSDMAYRMDVLKSCAGGTTESLLSSCYQVIAFAFLQGLLFSTIFPTIIQHFLLTLYGILVSYTIAGGRSLLFVHLYMFVMLFIVTTVGARGRFAIFTGIAYIISLEYYLPSSEMSQIRGMLMIMTMKIIAFATDYDKRKETDLIQMYAYFCNPATVIFGPFITFAQYEQLTDTKKSLFAVLDDGLHGIMYICISLFFVIISSCAEPVTEGWRLPTLFMAALCFRCSHYFVSYLSQGLSRIGGFEIETVRPTEIELPRSILSVVNNWNLSMHLFLKKYVYVPLRNKKFGIPIILTFVTSSALHGFNIKLSIVLVTLGFYAFFEHEIRSLISTRFSMCVRSRQCQTCNHRNKSSNLANLINFVFSLTAIYELMFLGSPFTGNVLPDSSIYLEVEEALNIWKSQYYAGFIIPLIYGLFWILLKLSDLNTFTKSHTQ